MTYVFTTNRSVAKMIAISLLMLSIALLFAGVAYDNLPILKSSFGFILTTFVISCDVENIKAWVSSKFAKNLISLTFLSIAVLSGYCFAIAVEFGILGKVFTFIALTGHIIWGHKLVKQYNCKYM